MALLVALGGVKVQQIYGLTIRPQKYWHVFFIHTGRARKWWDIGAPSWAQHVMMASWCPSQECWLVVDPASGQTMVGILNDDQWNQYLFEMKNRIRARILFTSNFDGVSMYRHRMFQTCSTIIARMLGVDGGALRPIDLFHSLLANNGQLKLDKRNERKSETRRRRSRN